MTTVSDTFHSHHGRNLLANLARMGAERWLILFSILYFAGALALSPGDCLQLTWGYWSPFLSGQFALLLLGPLIAAPFVDPKQPLRTALALLKKKGPVSAIVIACFLLWLSAFTTYKVAIPRIIPFYADRAIADTEQ